MGQQIITYPRLYQVVTAHDEGGDIFSQGDQSVIELYREYETGMHDTQGLNFRFRVIDCALRLFGDFRTWTVLQRNNPNLIGYNIEFLRDTIKFITTGHREMYPLVWAELVSEKNEHAPHATHLTLPELNVPHDMTTPQVIQLWGSRRGGFEDMLQTLFVLFGFARGPGR